MFIKYGNFRYLGGGDFTGRVFCSTLEGEFVKAFGYTNGQLNGTLVVMKRSELEKHKDEEWSRNYSSINLMEGVRTRAGTYVFDEGGGSSGLCPHGYPENSCSICLDEVVVTGCRYCHMQNGCICDRCFYCGNKEPECWCTRCIRCGNKMPECTCYLYPDPNPDPNPGGGGGGGIDPVEPSHCQYGICSGNPCTCCPTCHGICKCSGCHKYPCECCPGVKCIYCGGIIPGSAPLTRSNSECPSCTCWNGETHYDIIDAVAEACSLPEAWVSQFRLANDWCDNLLIGNQASEHAYLHAMNTDPNISTKDAQTKFENHLKTYLTNFVNNGYLHDLGVAIHGITDSFCPSHMGFQYYSFNPLSMIEHAKWDKGENSPQAVQNAKNAVSEIINIIKERKSDSVQKVIEYWRETYKSNLEL